MHPEGYDVRISLGRDVTQGLHSIEIAYAPDVVGVDLRLGTWLGFETVAGLRRLNAVVEHTVVHLREPVGGRRDRDAWRRGDVPNCEEHRAASAHSQAAAA